MGKELKILLAKYKPSNSSVFTGRPQGEDARKAIDLDKIEDSLDSITVVIPQETTSLNPSFFLGLFYDSIKKNGDVSKFLTKFHFEFESNDNEVVAILNKNLKDALRNAETALKLNISL